MSDNMNKPNNRPPISAENLGFYCSQLLDNELPAAELERLLEQTAHSPADRQITQQLHRYALIRQHLQASPYKPIASHIDLSARVQAALNQAEQSANHDEGFDPLSQRSFDKFSHRVVEAGGFDKLSHRVRVKQDTNHTTALHFLARRGRTTWALSGIAAGMILAVSLSWLNQYPTSESPLSTQLANLNAIDLSTQPVSVQELNQAALAQQQILVEQARAEHAQLRAYAQLADAERARFNEYFLMHAGYGSSQNSGLTLARVADLPSPDYSARQQNSALIVQPVGYPE
jgi:hypothetical protein